MKNNLLLLTVAALLSLANSCSKCYKCHNLCRACYETHSTATGDTTLTIIVRSDVLGADYFLEYTDSLTSPSLGWVCHDTTSNFQERFCESESKSAVDLINKKDAGLVCAPDF